MAIKLSLTNATIKDNKFVEGSALAWDGTVGDTIESASASISDDNGTVTFSKDVLSFKGVEGKAYDFSTAVTTNGDAAGDGAKTLTAISLAGAAEAKIGDKIETFTGSRGNDILELADLTNADLVINMGAGDDTVKGKGDGQKVTLGAGKDTVEVEGSLSIEDYNYKEDVIKGMTALTSEGKATGQTGGEDFEVSIGEGKDVYYAQDETGKWFATAAEGANAKIALAFDKEHGEAVIDTSDAMKADITLTGKKDAEAAKVTVTLSEEEGVADVITVGTGSKDKVSVTVDNFEADAEAHDKLVLSGAKLNDTATGALKIAAEGANDTKITYKDATVVLTKVKDKGVIDLNGTTLAFDVKEAGASVLKDTDAQTFYGKGDKSTTLEVSKSTYLNVNAANYQDIYNITLNEDMTEITGIQIGGSKEDDTIDVHNSLVGVEVYGDKGDDAITLSEGADTLWVGGNNKDTDTVTGFKYGSVAEADTLYLFDTAKLADIKLAAATDADNHATVTAGKSNAKLADVKPADNDSAFVSEILKVKLQDGNTYNVLAELNKTAGVELDAADQESVNFFVLSKDGSIINLAGEEGTSSFLNSGYTDMYTGKLAGVNGEEMKGDMTVGNVKAVTLGSGTNEYWAFGDGDAELNDGTDTIWFQAGVDKKVVVRGFDAENDSIKLLGTTDVASVAEAYKFTVDDGQTVIAGIGTASKMTLGVDGAPITIKTDTEEFKAVAVNGGTADFADGVSIYSGMDTIEVMDDVAGPVTVGMGTASSKLMGGAFISNSVTTFDASNTDAVTVIRGSETTGSTIMGGNTKNDMYGGGTTKDTLVGNDSAVDTFWFGANDGVDAISTVDAKDSVYLWNVSSADIATVTVTANDDAAKLVIGTSAVLHIEDLGLTNAGQLTFTTSDGANFVYDAEQKKLVAKQ